MIEKKPRRYAQNTSVDPARTRAEIDTLVTKHGATGFVSGWAEGQARVMFEMRGRRLRFSIQMLPPDDPKFTRRGHAARPPAQVRTAYEQFEREQWRLLLLLIKGKLEAIRSNAAIFEEEMLPYTVLPTGQTVAEWMEPQLNKALESGTMPPLLPG